MSKDLSSRYNKVIYRYRFDAGHRLVGHTGKCRHLHGHSYTAEIEIWSRGLDGMGMVLDFGDLKGEFVGWIDKNWDHNLLLNSEDPLLDLIKFVGDLAGSPDNNHRMIEEMEVLGLIAKAWGGKTPYIFSGKNPTAEVMAAELFDRMMEWSDSFSDSRDSSIPWLYLKRVRIEETPNCFAELESTLSYPL